jgi:hypothetical protein
LTDKTNSLDTLIHIPGISADALLQRGHAVFASYEDWHRTLLMAIIQHEPIDVFLETAAEKLTNPLALFDNTLAVLSTA